MRLLLIAVLFFTFSCAPIDPSPVSVSMDAGKPSHRLLQGKIVTADGFIGIAPLDMFDTALNVPCYVAQDSLKNMRCFPKISYRGHVFVDHECTISGVIVADSRIGLAGQFRDDGSLAVFRVGATVVGDEYWTMGSTCVAESTTGGERVFVRGEDITSSLETLTLIYQGAGDSP